MALARGSPRASGAWLWRLAREQGSGVKGAGQSGPLPLASGSGLLALDSYRLLPFSSSLLYLYICISICISVNLSRYTKRSDTGVT